MEKIISLKKNARIAGSLYLLLTIAGLYGLMYVSSKITVDGDAASNAKNILNNEFLFRSGIAVLLIAHVIFLLLSFALYRLFKQVHEPLVKLMVTFVIVQIPIAVLIEVFKITALMILKGDVLKAVDPAQLQDMATVFLKSASYGTALLEIFWGLWLMPLALLVHRSGFIPGIIGVLLMINGVGYCTDSMVFLFFPKANTQFLMTSFFGEPVFMLWLLIKGVNAKKV